MKNQAGKRNDVLGATYEPGKPSSPDLWRLKLQDRDDILKYIQVSEKKYWFEVYSIKKE